MTDARKVKESQCKELIKPLIDATAFLEKVTTKLKQFQRDFLKPRLPEKVCQFANNVPGNSTLFLGDDLNNQLD